MVEVARARLAAIIAALAGCAPVSDSPEVVIIARDAAGRYGLETRVVIADDLAALRGEAAEFIARPTLVWGDDGTATIDGGQRLDIHYGQRGDTLVPLDQAGLVAVSAYYHLTRAREYFGDVGLGVELAPFTTLYQPLVDYGPELGVFESHDNAAFVPSVRAFLLLEELWLDYVPLAANEGVIAHELSHAVFDELTGGPRPDWDQSSRHMWQAIDEGLADVHAVAFTGDPAYGKASAGRLVFNRDVSGDDIALTEEMMGEVGGESFTPYPIGTVFAAVFWDYYTSLVAGGVDRELAARALGQLAIRSVRALSQAPQFHLGELAQSIATEAGSEPARQALCDAMWARAAVLMDGVEACP